MKQYKIATCLLVMVVLVLFSQASAAQQEQFENRKQPFDTLHYDLQLKINYENEKLIGACRMTIANFSNEPVNAVPMLLYRLLKVNSVKDDKGKPLRFAQRILSFEDFPQLQENFIEILLDRPVLAGEKTILTVEYDGYLLGRTEVWGYVKDRIDRDFTIIRRDCSPYPSVGYPSEKANGSVVRQRFSYRAEITVPDSLVVANGGKLIDTSKTDGLATYTYQSIKPSWRLDFAIADYHFVEDGKNKVFCLREDAARGEVILKALTRSINLYTQWFGPLHDHQGLTVIEIPDDWGSQTDVTTIIQTAAAFKDDDRLYELYHEASHLWNVKPTEEHFPRWEEGLACFLQYLTVEELEKRKILEKSLKRVAEYLQEVYAENPEYKTIPMADFGKRDITDLSYSVGRIFFAVLYDLVGKNDFNTIIGSFYQEFNKSGATTAEFLSHAQKKTSVDLGRMFDEWFTGVKYTEYIVNGLLVDEIAEMYRADLQ